MKQKILSFILSLAILLQFAGCTKTSEREESTTEITTELGVDEFTEEDLLALLNQIAAIDVNYNYEEYYDVDYEDVMRVVETNQECDYVLEEYYDYIDLWYDILDNSKIDSKYNINTNDFYYGKNDKENAVVNTLLYILFKLENELSVEDFCKMKNVSIKVAKIEENGVLACYDDNIELITIDYDKILQYYNEEYESYIELNANKKDEFITFEEYLEKTIRHELNHARQFICDCRENKGQENINICYNQEKFGNSLIESSAESEAFYPEINIYKEDAYVLNNIVAYSDERRTQSLLLLMGLFKDNFTLEKYYDVVFNADLKGLHELFELNTEEEIENFYKIYFSLNTYNRRTTLAEYLINEKGIETYGDYYDEIGNDYKIEIFKVVCSDLINKIYKDNISLKDCLTLYNYTKMLVLNSEGDLKEFDNGDKITCYNERFLKGIGTVDSIFYQFVTNYYEKSLEEIKYEELECLEFAEDLFWKNYYSTTDNREFIEKYPLISEISFCNTFVFDGNITIFDKAYENGYTRERYLTSK